MIEKIQHMNHYKQQGFTLLEMLLTMVILGSTLLLITKILEETARNEFYNSNSDYMNVVMDAALDMVDSLDDFNAVHSLAQGSVGNVMEVPVTDDPANAGVNAFGISLQSGGLNSVNVVAQTLPANPSLNTNFNELSPLGPRITVLYQALDNPLNPTDERRLGVLVTLLGQIPDMDLRRSASSLGAGGGFISGIAPTGGIACLPVGCASTIRSSFGGWVLDATPFAGERWGTLVTGTPATAGAGGYLVFFRFITSSDVAGDYLYRTPQLANPELNRMNQPLDMAGNNIIGADNIQITGDAIVTNEVHVQGSAHIAGSLQVQGGDISVDGDVSVGALNLGPTYTDDPQIIPPTRNNLVVENTLTAGNLTSTQSVFASQATLGTTSSPAIRSNSGTSISLDATGSSGVFSSNTTANNLDVTQQIRAGTMQSATANVTGGVGTLNVITSGNYTTNSLQSQDAYLENVDINLLEQCLSGC